MSIRRRLARGATVLAVALAALPTSVLAVPAGTETTTPSTSVAPSTTATPSPGDVEIINSWALGPADQSGTSNTGKRSLLSYVADPGSVIKDAVTLYNLSNVPLRFKVYGTDGLNGPDGAFGLLPSESEPSDVGSWVALPQEMVDVQPGQQVTMPITITVPADATPGDHTGAIVASSPARSTDANGASITIDRRTGTRLNLRVNGPLRAELAVEGLETSYHPSLNPFDGRVTVSYRIHNRGNVRLGGQHVESVAGLFGAGRRRNPASEFPEILPGQSVTIETSFDKVPALLRATATVVVTPGDSGDGLIATKATKKASALAPPILILVLLAIVLAIVVRRRIRKHRGTDVVAADDEADDDEEFDDEEMERR